jgi:hypothetical protein
MRALVLLPLLPACVLTAHTEVVEETFDEPIVALDAEVDGGFVEVHAVPCDDALVGTGCGFVSAELGWTRERPRLRAEVVDGILEVRGTCSPQARCWVDLFVDVPPEADARVRTGSGSITVLDLAGDLDLGSGSGSIDARGGGAVIAEAGSGSIDVDGATGDLDLETGSGAIDAVGLRGATARMHAGSGSVDARFLATPTDVAVDTGSGSVDLSVPAGVYDLELHAGSGSIETRGVEDRTGAPHRITVDTGSGSISVVGR